MYLQVASFREKAFAIEFGDRLARLGFECDIREFTIDDQDVYHWVRVGPFTNPAALEKSRQKLGELGFNAGMPAARKNGM